MNFILLFFALRIIESKKHLRIFGGRDAAENEYPYVARFEILRFRNDKIRRIPLCTSTILTRDWTLTSAHCFDGLKILDITRNKTQSIVTKEVIWYGHVRAAATKDVYSDILYSVKHPATYYRIPRPDLFINDVALVRTQPIKIKEYGKLSALDAKSFIGQEVHVVGYGITNSSDRLIANTMILKKPLQVLKAMITSCSGKLKPLIHPIMCLASPCGVWSLVYRGDSGGPVIHPSGVVALISLGENFATSSEEYRPLSVGFLTPTSPYTDWISSMMTK